MKDSTNAIASKHLGKKSSTALNYDPSLLVAIPRKLNRIQYEIDENNLPFLGQDVWHCFEFSVLTQNNLPISRLLKIKYNSKSEFLVESKSLKLYLNSFNMARFGENIEECLEICKNKIKDDLSNALKTDIELDFFENAKKIKIFENFENILNFADLKNLKIEKFKETKELIKLEEKSEKKYFLRFDSLRSNCRVTHQPDFGELFIYYKSKKHIIEGSLIQYLTSFRQEYHFHEECVEMIYKRLFDILDKEDELFVCALYTRRGGIDINPVRYSKNCSFDGFFDLIDVKKLTLGSIKQ